jgi:pimeloyl-ACP methyl ester carboxylesterase
MRTRLLAVFLFVLAGVSPASAQWATVDTFTIKGAHGLIIIPENWNGGLFIYAHGYSADERILQPFPPDLTPANATSKLNLLFQAVVLPPAFGYASATTTFRSVGWSVKDSIKDIESVRRRFEQRYGTPRHTYLWGHSGGGMVTSTVIETVPGVYDGALPMCGPGAGARRNFNGAFDLRALYEYVCGDVPGARFACRVCSDHRTTCLADRDCPHNRTCGDLEPPSPPEDGLSEECTSFLLSHPDRFSETPSSQGGAFVDGPATACFGDLSGGTPPSPEQQARRDLFVRASQIPESFVTTDLFFATVGMAEVVHRRTRGHHPWSNLDVDYASPLLTPAEREALNAGILRVAEDPDATVWMRRYYEPRGRTRTKVITVHALDDGLVLPENEDKYRQAFEAAGRDDQLVQLFTDYGGHCGFINELFPALQALTAWVEQGITPSTDSVRAACPGCRFVDTLPGPWGLKVVERRQRGVPVNALVCSGEDGDCPTGAVCDLSVHRCR